MKISTGRFIKVLALLGTIALCLLLTGCVVPPDDIGTNGNYVVNNNDLPFQSLKPTITATPYTAPTATNTPTATPTPTRNPFAQGGSATPTVNISGIGVNNGQTANTPSFPQIILPSNTTSASTVLKLGSKGDDVKKMQQRLKELDYLKGSADGDFGEATETAVKNFQANNGLQMDGVAGSATLNKLYSSSARKAPSTVATNKPTNTPFTSLKLGSEGSEVRKMQQRLKELGYLKGSADGDFGEATEAAVRAFQKAHGLTVDGKAGTATLNKLYSSSAKKASTATAKPTATPTARPTATPDLDDLDYYLELGASGNRVRTLQNRLIELGWLEGKADGVYRHATEYAVKAFQARYNSLYDDGIAGPDTLRTLYSAGAATTRTPASSLGVAVEYGDENDVVKAMQNRLKELGYFTTTANGKFGPATKAAVIAFQTVNGLTVSGNGTVGTINNLYSASAKNASYLEDEEDAREEEDKDVADDPVDANAIVVGGYTTLRRGDKGSAVKKLQQALKNQGYYSGSIDSAYGSEVQSAVKTFQKQNGMKADGVAGPATQIILYGATASSADTSTTLKKESTGTAVRNLQYVLYELGYYDGSITGHYGDLTADAVRAFQIANDLDTVDGVAGKETLKVLYSGQALGVNAVTGKFDTLSKGDKGSAVVELQETLYKLGYLSEITGEYDSATVEAVKNLQKRNNLTVTGKADQKLQQLIYFGEPTPAW